MPKGYGPSGSSGAPLEKAFPFLSIFPFFYLPREKGMEILGITLECGGGVIVAGTQ